MTHALYKLAASTAERKYGNIYPRTQELHKMLQNSQVAEVDSQIALNVLMTRFLGAFRSLSIHNISLNFRRIIPPQNSSTFGKGILICPPCLGTVVPREYA